MSRVVVHLSDLHFGRVDAGMVEPLVEAVERLRPDVIAISGDLTQRARPPEFQQARAFLENFQVPLVVVPGNHDVPLYDLYRRFVKPLDRFYRFITDVREPSFIDREIAVIGINTARSLTWKGGRVNHTQIMTVRNVLCALDPDVIRIVVTHHPFDLPKGYSSLEVVGRSRMAMSRLAECGADILLSGHLHVTHISDTVHRYNIHGHSALVVQAGTASSNRHRGERNSFNCLRVDGRAVTIEHWTWSDEKHGFTRTDVRRFERVDGLWQRPRAEHATSE